MEEYPQARKRRLAERAAREDAEGDERTEEVRAGRGFLGTYFSAVLTHRLTTTFLYAALSFSPLQDDSLPIIEAIGDTKGASAL